MLSWITKPANFRRFEDAYALSRTGLYARLHEAIRRRLEMGELVFLVSHFPDTFTELTEQLEQWQVEFEIVTSPIDRQWFGQLRPATPSGRVYLHLAEMLVPLGGQLDGTTADYRIAIMVTERHPLPARDAMIETFVRSLVYPVQLGYFLSLRDVVVRKSINENSIELLKQLGLKEHELITSHMVSSRLDKVLKRLAGPNHPNLAADSAEEWYQLNRPE